MRWRSGTETTGRTTEPQKDLAEEKKAESSNSINRIIIWRMELGSKTSSPLKNIFVLLYFIKVVLSIMV